jgi:uncharacterized protein (TIGR02996 family)
MTTSTDREALLRAIIAEPESDLHRFAYADEIEADDQARAEFIRVQCAIPGLEKMADSEIHNTGMCSPYCTICPALGMHQALERKWIDDNRKYYRKEYGVDIGQDRQGAIADGFCEALFSRGFVSRVEGPLTTLVGGECGSCNTENPISRAFARHSCSACHGTGHMPGVLERIVREHPVEEVRTDREPELVCPNDIEYFTWWPEGFWQPDSKSRLPDNIYRKMADAYGGFTVFPTRAAAHRALSDAILTLVRGEPITTTEKAES